MDDLTWTHNEYKIYLEKNDPVIIAINSYSDEVTPHAFKDPDQHRSWSTLAQVRRPQQRNGDRPYDRRRINDDKVIPLIQRPAWWELIFVCSGETGECIIGVIRLIVILLWEESCTHLKWNQVAFCMLCNMKCWAIDPRDARQDAGKPPPEPRLTNHIGKVRWHSSYGSFTRDTSVVKC